MSSIKKEKRVAIKRYLCEVAFSYKVVESGSAFKWNADDLRKL